MDGHEGMGNHKKATRVTPISPHSFLGNSSGLSALLIAWVMRSGKSLEEVMNGW